MPQLALVFFVKNFRQLYLVISPQLHFKFAGHRINKFIPKVTEFVNAGIFFYLFPHQRIHFAIEFFDEVLIILPCGRTGITRMYLRYPTLFIDEDGSRKSQKAIQGR